MEQKESILFQYVMNYKAYRRKMIMRNGGITLVVAGGLACTCLVRIMLGIILPAIALFLGAISILVLLTVEETYTVYNTRTVLKRRHADKRKSVPAQAVVAVRYRRAFYERDLATGTVIITAAENGRKKRYKLKHIFDAMPVVEYYRGLAEASDREE